MHKEEILKRGIISIEHAVLAQIYSLIRTSENLDRSTRPLTVSLVNYKPDIIEDYEAEEGTVYILKTHTYTSDNLEIIQIGVTTRSIELKLKQLMSTSIPFKLTVLKSYRTKNYMELVDALYKLLDPFKLNHSREYFTQEALEFIDEIVTIHTKIVQKSNNDME